MTNTETYKQRLEEELTSLQKELSAIGIHNPENSSDWVAVPEGVNVTESDPNDAADRVEDWDERRATVAVLEKRYNNLVRALKKIEEGNYGTCEISGEPIEEDRLDANPAARTCKSHLDQEGSLSA
ncbi:TraR/DksA C4-type zinc finger protein [bacterium]|nr:TraR/DksA C4-type zinc finger protein [bacterium]